MQEEEEGLLNKAALCWQFEPDHDVNHEYQMVFGYVRDERVAVLFQTVTTAEGVEAKPYPVAFIPFDALCESISPRWWEPDFDGIDGLGTWITGDES